MMTPGHIVSMYVTTSGLTGPQLGSDEKEIILLVYAVIDPASSKVSPTRKTDTHACVSAHITGECSH